MGADRFLLRNAASMPSPEKLGNNQTRRLVVSEIEVAETVVKAFKSSAYKARR